MSKNLYDLFSEYNGELPEIKEVIIEDKDDDLFKTKYNDEN